MNNKIRKKLLKEFNKYNLDESILDNYNFKIKDRKFVYIKDNKNNNFIDIGNNKGVRLKRNSERKFKLQILDTNSKKKNAVFLEELDGGSEANINDPILEFYGVKDQNFDFNNRLKWDKSKFSIYFNKIQEEIIEKLFKNKEFLKDIGTSVEMDKK